YMHARHFITTEPQLEAAVEAAFTHPDGRPKTDSFWQDEGTRPLTTQEMLGSTRGADANLTREERASGRMRKLAEELTGGKIADEWTSGRL
ncbi:MAG: hypothetical protein INR71_12685, partial [Terriglobus roseus]|nr:hypothetical protein [Terriglobus roseus]